MQKNFHKYINALAFVLVIVMIIPIGGSFYKTLLANIRYATLNEKDPAKEIIIQRENPFNSLDISEYKNASNIIIEILYPCYEEINPVLENITQANRDDFQISDNIHSLLLVLEKWQPLIFEESQKQQHKLKEILIEENNAFLSLIADINKIENKSTYNEFKVINEKLLVSTIKDFYFNFTYRIIYFIHNIKENINLMAIYNHLANSVNNIDNDPLIDLETPYFSLPFEYAEAKEKQIFNYIAAGKNDARTIMALIILYIKMKNITDAELLYYSRIAPLKLSNKQDNDLANSIHLMLNELRNQNPNAYLVKSKIIVDSNMQVLISENYTIDRPDIEKDVFVFLPYNNDRIKSFTLSDDRHNDLSKNIINKSWKNSCYLQFQCKENLLSFTLEYSVDNFFEYSENYGTFSFRYGGINNSNNYTCVLQMVNMIKPSTFISPASSIILDEKRREIEYTWVNPTIPFKISSLGIESQKNGLAGEVVYSRMLYIKFLYSYLILCLFIAMTVFLTNIIKNDKLYEIMFTIISLSSLWLLYRDVHYINLLERYIHSIPFNILNISRYILVGISCLGILFMKYKRGNRYFKVASLMIVYFIFINGFNNVILNTDLSNMKNIIRLLACGVIYLFFFVEQLSEQLNVTKGIIWIIVMITIIISLFVSNIIKNILISSEKLNIVGLIISILFALIIIVCYIIEQKKIRNAKDQNQVELIIDGLVVRYQGKTIPLIHVLIIALITISIVSRSTWFIGILGLIVAIYNDEIKKLINFDKKAK